VDAGRDPGVHVEPEVAHEGIEVAARVGDEPELHPLEPEVRQHGERVLVEIEVRRVEPPGRDGFRHRADARAPAAHPPDDVLREADPDLLVVLELGVVAEVLDRRGSRLGVEGGIERQPVPLPGRPVALGAQQGAGLREGEVDVEEDRVDPRPARPA
jgi:hypothetical protein